MTNEIIEFYREHLKPIIQIMLLETNYQGQGEVDYEEFGRDFDELLDLAIIGMQSNSDERRNCVYRHENGNCLKVGGFCLAVDSEYCEYQSNSDDDCISREAVLEIAKSSKSNWIDNSVLFKRVNDLPPVTPKPNTGHWIKVTLRSTWWYKCSECSCENWSTGMAENFNNYCPNCGAKMEGATE